MRHVLLFIAMVNSFEMDLDDHPYCAIRYRRLCQGKGRHVACQFPVPGPGEYCKNYTNIKFTREMKGFITTYINRRRQRLAAGNERVRGGALVPRPQLMMQVDWDRELAMLSQRLADQCTFVHDDCRATVRYPYAGQTVGEVRWRRSSDSDELSAQRAIRRVLDAWWGERRRVHPKQIVEPFRITPKGMSWGHFSQLAVWTLRAVGCAAVRHDHPPRLLLVCDFSHTNMLGQRTIAPGPLAPCPVHSIRKPRSAFPLLCATIRYKKIPADYPFDTYDQEYEDVERSVDDIEEFLDEEVGSFPERIEKPIAKPVQEKPRKKIDELKEQVTTETRKINDWEPSEEDSKVRVSEEYSKVRANEEHKKVRPNEEYSKVRPSEEYSKVRPNQEYSKLRPSGEYNKVRPSEEYSKVRPSEKYSRVPPNVEYSKVRSNEEYNKVRPSEENSKEIPSEEYSEVRSSEEYSKVESSEEYTKVRPSEEHNKVKPSKELTQGKKRRIGGKEIQSRRTNGVPFRFTTTYTRIFHVDAISTNRRRLPMLTTKRRAVQKLETIDEDHSERRLQDNHRISENHRVVEEETDSPQSEEFRSMTNEEDRNVNLLRKSQHTQQNVTPLRARWQQTRDRPSRPGANALLTSRRPIIKYQRPADKASIKMSLKMDKEDQEQLYRDTGFKFKYHLKK